MAVGPWTPRPKPFWTLGITAIAFFMVALDALVVVTALPVIHRDLRASLATLEWTVNAFTLAFAAGIIPAAALGDRLGRRRLFTIGLGIFTAASAACALAPTAGLLIVARAIQGIGAAAVMPVSLTILTSAFPPQRRGAVIGAWGGIAGLAVASGPLVGGAITQGLDWHWIFWVNVPIGVVAILVSLALLTESYGPATRLDLPAAILVAGAAVGIVWGLIRAGEVGWSSTQVIGLLGVGLVLLGGFLLWERRVPEPMLPLRLFANPGFAAANVAGFLMAGSLNAAAFLVSQYFQFALGYSPLETGLRLLPWTATPLVIAPLAGVVSDRIGRRPVLVTGLLMQGVGLAWIGLLAETGASYGQVVPALIIAGIGISMAIPVVATTVMSTVSHHDMGKASGVNSTVQRFGVAFVIAVAAAVFSANGHIGTPVSFVSGFRPALLVIAGISMLGAIAALAAGGRRMPVAEQAPVAEMAASA